MISRIPRRWRYVGASFIVSVLAFLALPVVKFEVPYSTVVLARDGGLIAASIASDEQWRFPLQEEVPRKIALAVQRFEDRRFPYHPGVDPIALVRAFRSNLKAGRVVSGGSTITMQVVRLARNNPPRTYGEKIIEALLALRFELAASKDDILGTYLSHAPFGGNVVGLEAAAWRYFGRPATEISWAEAATLAVLPNNPALVHPGRNRAALRAKRDRLLEGLAEEGALSIEDLQLAVAEPLPGEPKPIPQLSVQLLDRSRREYPDSPRLRTTIDRRLQQKAAAIVTRHSEHLAGNHINNAAALILDVKTGETLAYVGNVGELTEEDRGVFVDLITAPRSTGSVLKPFLYTAMLQDGELLPGELVPDIPMRIGDFAPQNFDKEFDGAVPARVALARSLNIPASWMLRNYGVDRFYGVLRDWGMSTLFRSADDYGLSLILGGAEGTLWDLTGMYASLARVALAEGNGRKTPAQIHPPKWNFLGETPASGGVRMDPGAAYLALEALVAVKRPGVEDVWERFASGRRVAWKTGTSIGFRDAWAIGVTPEVAIGVWVGNASGEGRPELTGHLAAAPLLFELFGLFPQTIWFQAPPGALAELEVCDHSGMRAGPRCTEHHAEKVPLAALEKAEPCSYCQNLHCESEACRWRVHGSCQAVADIFQTTRFVLPAAMEAFYAQKHPTYRALPSYRGDCREQVQGFGPAPLSILFPRPGSDVYIPIELDGKRGKVVFTASHRDPQGVIHWHLDDRYLGTTREIHQLPLAPAPGEHVVTIVDHHGESIERRFHILEGKTGSPN